MKFQSFRLATGLTLAATLMAGGVIHTTTFAGPFTAGNLAVLRASASANNTTATIVELDRNTPAQAPSNEIAIPGTGTDALRISGSATSTGYLSHTNDRTLLTFNGANNSTTSSNVNTLNPRGVGTLDASGTFAIQTTYTGAGGDQTRSATSLNNTDWFIGDQGGMFTNGGNAPSPAGNIRGVKAFGGTVYVGTASATLSPVNTINAPTGGTLAALPGLANGTSAFQDFYLIQSGSNGSVYDVLYVLSATNNTAGTIAKHSLVGGSWVANGSYTTTFGGFGLAAQATSAAPGANLFVTTGQGALAVNSVLKLFDAAGFNAAIDITTANNVTLYTAGTGQILKGIDFAPTAVPEPSSLVLVAAAAVFGVVRRRK